MLKDMFIEQVEQPVRRLPMREAKEKTLRLLPKFAFVKRWSTPIPSGIEEILQRLDQETQWFLRTYESILLDIHDTVTTEIGAKYLTDQKGVPSGRIRIGTEDHGVRWVLVQPGHPEVTVLRPRQFLFWQRPPQIEEQWPSIFHLLLGEIAGELWVYQDEEKSRQLLNWVLGLSLDSESGDKKTR